MSVRVAATLAGPPGPGGPRSAPVSVPLFFSSRRRHTRRLSDWSSDVCSSDLELAHYARACVDILFKFPFGTQELEGIAARSDFDLSQHARFSGKLMGVFDDELRAAWAKLPKEKQDELWKRYYENRKKYLTKMAKPDETPEQIQKQATEDANGLAKGQYIPHVIEPSAGVDRLILALICNAYSETTKTDDKGKSETLYVMKFHPRVAPIKVGVLPLLKNKPELVNKALAVRDL